MRPAAFTASTVPLSSSCSPAPRALCSRGSHGCAPLQAMSRGLQTMSEGGGRWNVARRRVMSRSAPAAAAAWDASGQALPISRYETTFPNSAGQDPLQPSNPDIGWCFSLDDAAQQLHTLPAILAPGERLWQVHAVSMHDLTAAIHLLPRHLGLYSFVPRAAAAQVQPWWAYEADSDGVEGRQLTGKPSVFFRKTVNAHTSCGEDVAVNAQQYAVLVMDVPDLRPAHARWLSLDIAPTCVTTNTQ